MRCLKGLDKMLISYVLFKRLDKMLISYVLFKRVR